MLSVSRGWAASAKVILSRGGEAMHYKVDRRLVGRSRGWETQPTGWSYAFSIRIQLLNSYRGRSDAKCQHPRFGNPDDKCRHRSSSAAYAGQGRSCYGQYSLEAQVLGTTYF